MVDIAVVAIFVLGERPVATSATRPGQRAAAAFVIEDGLIRSVAAGGGARRGHADHADAGRDGDSTAPVA